MKREGRKPNTKCVICKEPFYAWRLKDDSVHTCSLECRGKLPRVDPEESKERAKTKAHIKKMTKAIALAKDTKLSPQQSAQLRGKIAKLVSDQVTHANEVVLGVRDWSPTQARVFSTLLNKIVPDLSASYVQHEHNTKDVIDMSREELERIAAGIDAIDAEEVTDENN